ncbi:ABC-F family ATP-binding cassette domain-containing protein [Cesiribacter andamanensis]|uniref:Putative ABC transporter ATP-binding protein n=1 Tax=Cesiribacter andamanensis AMV16 TaxID=1279009 RepID=M7NSJ6_9BACT|nr:ABC-F family ATP-binding cassette domain-containing protein [Cesiribacter andamanensis]EMR01459.1 putative ABC transporter ATP-binding protein [Cesiribacter andamanensis AMV16]
MNILSVENLSKQYHQRQLFDTITFGIGQGQKVALIGRNGTGKSTLLKILAGVESADAGQVVYRSGTLVAYLPQHPKFNENNTVREALFDSSNPTLSILAEYEYLLEVINEKPELGDRFQEVMSQIDSHNLWDFESQVKQILGKLGIHDLQHPVKALSGGQRRRVALAKALLERPHFLILDEPTNHLDLPAIEWLEEYLSKAQLSLLMVTHDRYFMEQVTNEVLELSQTKLFGYRGSYSYYLEKKAERQEQQQAEVDKAKNLMRKELDWVRRQPKARGTKAKYRMDAFEDLKEKAGQKVGEKDISLQTIGRRLGTKIVELEGISKSYGDKQLFQNFSYSFRRGDKLGLIGPNGAGKSTFLNILTGAITPDTGTVDVGQTLQIGYYRQEEQIFDPNMRVIEVVKEVAEVIPMADGRTLTAGNLLLEFGFSGDQQYTLVGKLSGGEKRRLQLLRILMQNPNFLILDEPTNDLDISTLNVLENFLESYGGCLIIVSHDRYFMDRLVDHLFVFGQGGIRDFPGNYTDWRLAQEEEQTAASAAPAPKPAAKPIEAPVVAKPVIEKRKLSYKEQKEFEKLEKEIAQINKQKEVLIQKMNAGGDHAELMAWGQELEVLNEQLDEKEMRWLELSELA